MFERVEGIKCFKRYFPNKPWCYFHDVLEFRWYREFDHEEWDDRIYLKLTMSSEDRKDVISFIFSDCNILGGVCFNGWISGLDIINRTQDFQKQLYEVVDFEDDSLHIMCTDFSIKILQVDGRTIVEEEY